MPFVKNDNKNKAKNEWLRQGVMIFAESTGWIAFPVIGALYLGRWLDEKQGTEPLYFLSITAVAFIISSVGIGLTGVKYMKRIESSADVQTGDNEENNKLKTLNEVLNLPKDEVRGKKKDENESRDK